MSTITSTTPAGRHRAQSAARSIVVPVVLVIVGMLVMLYPVVSTVLNNYETTRAASAYAEMEQQLPEEVKNQQWDDAHTYNEEHATGPILDPWLNDIAGKTPDYEEYLHQLNATDAMARLTIPSINLDLPIYHGTQEDALQRGLGHLYGSELPVGGKGTHSVITGHTGLPNNTLFDNLRKVHEGDAFFVSVAGHKLKYVVDQISVVLPEQTEQLRSVDDKDYITLITCTPYGINTHRLLVRGHAEPITAEEVSALDDVNATVWMWWMTLLVAAAVLIAAALAWWLYRRAKAKSEAKT